MGRNLYTGITCRYLAALLTFVAFPVHSVAETVDRVVARVNGELITESDLRKAVPAKEGRALDPEAVGNLLDRTLLLQEARRQKIDLPEDALQQQVDGTVRELRAKYPSEKDFMQALAAEGMSVQDLKGDLKKRIRTDFQVFQAVTAGSVVSEEEIKRFEENRRAEGRSPTSLRLRRLGVPIKAGQESEACEKVQELVRKINLEELTFEEGVRRYSAVPGAKEDGGDLGWMELSKLSPQVVEATTDLEPGQASAPVVAGEFANIFYVEGKRGGRTHLLEQRFSDQRRELLERLRRQAQIEIYGGRLAGSLPKVYAGRVQVESSGTRNGLQTTSADRVPQVETETAASAPEPAPTPAPRKGLMRFFRRSN